jgi:hypothetical protein
MANLVFPVKLTYTVPRIEERDIYLLDGKLFDSESPAADDKERLSADLKGRKQKHEGWPNVYQATVSATIKWSQGFTAKPKVAFWRV